MVPDIADVKIAVAAKLKAVGLLELRLSGRSSIAGIPGGSRPGDGGDDAGLPIDPPDRVVLHVGDVGVSGAVEADFVGQAEGGFEGGAAISGVAGLSGAGHGVDRAIRVDLADALPGVFTKPEGAIGPADQAERIVDLCGGGWAPISAEALGAGAGKGFDLPIRRDGGKREEAEE